MPAPDSEPRPQRRPQPSDVSMKDLLASCAAASAVSTPPDEPSAVSARAEREHAGARLDAA